MELGSNVVLLETLAAERIVIPRLLVTGDVFNIADMKASSFLSGVELSGIGCFRQLQKTTTLGGWSYGSKSPMDLFKYTLEKYGSATLHVTFNGTHVELSENPNSYVLCAVDTLSNSEFRDSTAAIVNAKYHSHLSELYGLL